MKHAPKQADLLGAHGAFAFLSLLDVGTQSRVLIWPMISKQQRHVAYAEGHHGLRHVSPPPW